MSIVRLTKWGNSIGIRIPSSITKEAQLCLGEELDIKVNKHGVLTLIPIKNKQDGWLEQFNAVADLSDEGDLAYLPNTFDADEWTW